MKQEIVINELKEMIVNQLERAHELKKFSEERLRQNPKENAWSVYQCLEHLNRYSDFYLLSIEERLDKADSSINFKDQEFTAGFWGKQFCEGMLPDSKGKLKKMNTFKSKNPLNAEVSPITLEKFIDNQERWLQLLDESRSFDLNKNKCKLTIPLIKMNLGSTLRFVIYHQERHLIQAEKALGEF